MLDVSQNSRFYNTWRYKWHQLEWFVSFCLPSADHQRAASSAMYLSKKVQAGMDRATWGGKTRTGAARSGEMVIYLSELIDELLMDRRYGVLVARSALAIQH